MKKENIVIFNGKYIIELIISYDINQIKDFLLSKPELRYTIKFYNKYINCLDQVKYKDLMKILTVLTKTVDDDFFHSNLVSCLDISVKNSYPLDDNTLNFLIQQKVINKTKINQYIYNYNLLIDFIKYKEKKEVKKYG